MKKVSEKTAEVNRKLTADFAPKLAEVLSPAQVHRLKQIQLQANGIDVWTEPEFAKELELTDDQTTKLTELRNEYSRRQQLLDGDFQQRFSRIRELNTERDNKGLELLTAGQKTRLTELKGQSFDVSQLGFRRARENERSREAPHPDPLPEGEGVCSARPGLPYFRSDVGFVLFEVLAE